MPTVDVFSCCWLSSRTSSLTSPVLFLWMPLKPRQADKAFYSYFRNYIYTFFSWMHFIVDEDDPMLVAFPHEFTVIWSNSLVQALFRHKKLILVSFHFECGFSLWKILWKTVPFGWTHRILIARQLQAHILFVPISTSHLHWLGWASCITFGRMEKGIRASLKLLRAIRHSCVRSSHRHLSSCTPHPHPHSISSISDLTCHIGITKTQGVFFHKYYSNVNNTMVCSGCCCCHRHRLFTFVL